VNECSLAAAADNDVLWKAACYRLAARFWPPSAEGPTVGVLGAARFVLADVIARRSHVRDRPGAQDELENALGQAEVLEPTETELAAAAELEVLAQRAGLELDAGESQLAAMVAARGIPSLDTGDKRAIRGFDALVSRSPTCTDLCGRVRCLEQLVLRVWRETPDDFPSIANDVCAEPGVDKTLSICFSCYSNAGTTFDGVCAALANYIEALQHDAPKVLVS
jgi:hypothetical protein